MKTAIRILIILCMAPFMLGQVSAVAMINENKKSDGDNFAMIAPRTSQQRISGAPISKEKKGRLKFAPDRIIVKFRSAAALAGSIANKIDAGEKDMAVYASPDANVINALPAGIKGFVKDGVTTIEPVFKELHRRMRKERKTEIELNSADFQKLSKKRNLPYGEPKSYNLSNVYLMKNIDTKGMPIEEMCKEVSRDPAIEYAEPDYVAEAQMAPNDPYYSSRGSWGQTYDDLYGLKKLRCGQSWNMSQGEGVVVAVIDTGVDYNHEDISANMWVNEDEIPNNGADDDHNGFIDDIRGWDFVNSDNGPMDDAGHGTHCAGIIAAVGNNGLGVIGVAPKAKIMPVKGLDGSGSGYTSWLVSCIYYAADNGADVLSNSWGGSGTSQALTDAFNYAYSKGCINVAAAGNDSEDVKGFFPANIDCVVAVAAVDSNDLKASFSNYGAKIDVAAPGVDILSLRASGTDMYGDGLHIVGTKYYRANGTSMAGPHVAGILAIAISQHQDWSSEYLVGQVAGMADSIESLNPGYKKKLGTGRVNAYRVLTEEQKFSRLDLMDYRVGNKGHVNSGDTANLALTLRNSSGVITGLEARLTSTSPYLTITPDAAQLGDMEYWTFLRTDSSPFVLRVSETCPLRYKAILELTITDSSDAVVFHTNIELRINYELPGWPVETGGAIQSYNSITLADIDNNGVDDVIAASDKVYVLSGNGKPLPGWPQSLKGYSMPRTPAVGDIDGDGDKEIVVATEWALFAWHHNGNPVNHFPLINNIALRSRIALSDLDGDGKDEIISPKLQNGGTSIEVLKYTAQGIVTAHADIAESSGIWYDCPAVGDLNNDGRLEFLITANDTTSNKGCVYKCSYDGTGVTCSLFAQINGESAISVVLGDMDKDSNLEALVWHGYDISAFRSDGTMMWTGPGTAPSLGDIDSDGFLEIVTSGGGPLRSVYRYDGTLASTRYCSNSAYWPPSLSDINGDGSTDIVEIDHLKNIYAWDNNGIAIAGFPIVQSDLANENISGWIEAGAIALGDINNDGLIDIVAAMNKTIYAVPCAGAYDADTSEWPLSLHDAKNTCSHSGRPPKLAPIGNKTTNENTQLRFTLSATDPDHDTLTYSIATLPSGASFSPYTQVFTWTPTYVQAGSYPVTFTVSDGRLTDYETIIITVNNVNRAPVAKSQSVTIYEDTPRSGALTGSDIDGDPLIYVVVTRPSHGTLSGTASNLRYAPAANYNGSDSFTFKVNDGTVDSPPATVSITVTPVNDAPVASISPVSTTVTNGKLSGTLDGSASSDPDGKADIISYEWRCESGPIGLPVPYPIVLGYGERFMMDVYMFSGYTRTSVPEGVYKITLTVTDKGGLSSKTTISVTVVNPPEAIIQQTSSTLSALQSTGYGNLSYTWSLISPKYMYLGSVVTIDTSVYSALNGSIPHGTYIIQLEVTDSLGNKHSTSRSVTL